jgi:hypothetical protein
MTSDRLDQLEIGVCLSQTRTDRPSAYYVTAPYYHVSWDAKPWGVAKYVFLRDRKAFCTDHFRYNIIYNDT